MSANSTDTAETGHRADIATILERLYGSERAAACLDAIAELTEKYRASVGPRRQWVDQSDVMLITYGDSVRAPGEAPLGTLREFLAAHAGDVLSAVHLLPHYPYSSDDGFAVIDYRAVDPSLGTWSDVEDLSADFEVMMDAVINHISRRSDWFQGYLLDDPRYRDFFITADPDADYSAVVRPRTLPLLTPVDTAHGREHVWTTFSDDQIDLNYANPTLLLEVLDILLTYVASGARFLRLDAIGFLWKSLGTSCCHLEETHLVIQLMRRVLEAVAPGTLIITETNVPHRENISYFGDGTNEAHLVYQFPLPPLVLHTFMTGNARHLNDWAGALEPTTPQTTYFNFLASHDGIGLRPTEGILTPDEVAEMCRRVETQGGRVSYRTGPDGGQSAYELNCNYLDAISLPHDTDQSRAAKFLAAQSILLSVVGVPGVYVHSLFGSRNDYAGLEQTGRNRTINREKLDRNKLQAELATEGHLRNLVFQGMRRLLQARRAQPAFHPNAAQEVLFLDDRVFALARGDGDETVIAVVNVSDEPVDIRLPQSRIPAAGASDLISGQAIDPADGSVTVNPYSALWIKAAER